MPKAQSLVAPVLLNGSIIKDAAGNMSVDVVPNSGINKDVVGRLQIDVPTAQTLVAPVSPTGGIERDSVGKIKLVDAVVRSLIMMDGIYHSWSNEFIKNNASGHWVISDNSSSKVAEYGVLSG